MELIKVHVLFTVLSDLFQYYDEIKYWSNNFINIETDDYNMKENYNDNRCTERNKMTTEF